jgi:2-oxoglutarate dehydrogenase E2 component (dihydrolipoamide succinyltransferase)
MAIAELVMPKLGESIMEATILKWHKQVGETVQQDETVLDIATDKVDSEVPSTVAGKIIEILFQVNDVVPIGAVIARIETGSTTSVSTSIEKEAVTFTTPAITPKEEQIAKTPIHSVEETNTIQEVPYTPLSTVTPIPSVTGHSLNRFYSPLVMNIANSEGVSMVELEQIAGTGNENRVTKKDILQYIADKKAGIIPAFQSRVASPVFNAQQPATAVVNAEQTTVMVPTPVFKQAVENHGGEDFKPISTGKFTDPASVVQTGITEIVEMDRMRKLIAKHMVDSVQTSPHVTSFAEADVTHMVLWRKKVKDEFEKREGTKLTFTPMFIECLVSVMKQFPLINCSLDGDKIIIKKDINIGMATALPSGNLIVPVIKCADQLNIVGLSKAVNGLADAARNNKLKPEDTTGGSFTLTNVGTFGSLMGTPIINQPQVAILAVGAIKKRAVVLETPDGDTIGIRHMMYLSLSYDHRIVDGSIGASFLTAVAKEFEKWDINKQWFQYL